MSPKKKITKKKSSKSNKTTLSRKDKISKINKKSKFSKKTTLHNPNISKNNIQPKSISSSFPINNNKVRRNKQNIHRKKTRSEHRHTQDQVKKIKEQLHNFARTYWGQQWINAALEYGRPFRMERGLRYAQEDRIENLTISPGMIFATVQGTAPTPYRVKILFDIFSQQDWERLVVYIAEEAYYYIELLENKFPIELLQLFETQNLDLFPDMKKINATCSCPDKEVPCKHIAATILYIARVIDYDPFLLLKLRGMPKEELQSRLSAIRSCGNRPIVKATKKIRNQIISTEKSFDIPSRPATDLKYNMFSPKNDFTIGFQFKNWNVEQSILEHLGSAPNIEDPEVFEDILRELYKIVMKKALNFTINMDK